MSIPAEVRRACTIVDNANLPTKLQVTKPYPNGARCTDCQVGWHLDEGPDCWMCGKAGT